MVYGMTTIPFSPSVHLVFIRLIAGRIRLPLYLWIAGLAVILLSGSLCAQGSDPGRLQLLRQNPKLKRPSAVLDGFTGGSANVPVIVSLSPPAGPVGPAGGGATGPSPDDVLRDPVTWASAHGGLRDMSTRKQLRAAVHERVGRIVNELEQAGLTAGRTFSYQFGFSARVTPAQLDLLLNHPDVVAVEPDIELRPHLAQGIALMQAGTIRSQHDGSGVSIAVCDTGLDSSHPRLGGGGFPNAKVIGGYDFGDNDADPRPHALSGDAHGTACAGLAAGDTGTVGDYIGGVAPGAKLYALKITGGTSGTADSSALIAAWEWAITHQYDDPANPILVISTSFGGGSYPSTCDGEVSALTTAAANAVAAGISLFASAGNEGYCNAISFPACISHVYAVGSVYDSSFGTYLPCVDQASCVSRTASTQCGTGWYAVDNTRADMVPSYSNSSSALSLLAPANEAYTTDIAGSGGYSPGDYYTSFGGTSAACPYAAGAAAVLQSVAKSETGSFLSPSRLLDTLVRTGDTVIDSKNGLGRSRINLGSAAASLKPDRKSTAPVMLLLKRKQVL